MTFEQTSVSRRAQIAHIMRHFDFARVSRTMKVLDWTWGEERSPTVAQLKKTARDVLGRVVGETTYASTGGFAASVDQWGHLSLAFVVTEWSACDHCAAKDGNTDY